jgi:phosphoserine aminotransferase
LTLENPEKGKGENGTEGEKSLGEVIVYVDKYIWKNKSFSSFEDLEKSLLEEQTKKSKNKYNIYLVPKGPDEIENLAELMDFCMENDINGILIPPNKQDQ